MESDRFDSLVRGAFATASRRGAMRAGIGILAATALAGQGVFSEEAEAKKKKKKKKKKSRSTCPADLPITCGTGCCPSEYALCCVGNLGQQGLGMNGLLLASLRAAGDTTCNPPSFTCCPVEQGGGSCGGNFSKCCPATTQQPFGSCTESNATCCPSEAGGGACPVERPKCCPGGFEGQDINRYSECCLASESCCQVNTDCPAGQVCDDNCCRAEMMRAPKARSVSVPRSGIAAQ